MDLEDAMPEAGCVQRTVEEAYCRPEPVMEASCGHEAMTEASFGQVELATRLTDIGITAIRDACSWLFRPDSIHIHEFFPFST